MLPKLRLRTVCALIIVMLGANTAAAIPIPYTYKLFTLNYPDGLKYTETLVTRTAESSKSIYGIQKSTTTSQTSKTAVTVKKTGDDFLLISKILEYRFESDDKENGYDNIRTDFPGLIAGAEVSVVLKPGGGTKDVILPKQPIDAATMSKIIANKKYFQDEEFVKKIIDIEIKDVAVWAVTRRIQQFAGKPAKTGVSWGTIEQPMINGNPWTMTVRYKVGNPVECTKGSKERRCLAVNYSYAVDLKSLKEDLRLNYEERRGAAGVERLYELMTKNLIVKGKGTAIVDPDTLIIYSDESRLTLDHTIDEGNQHGEAHSDIINRYSIELQ